MSRNITTIVKKIIVGRKSGCYLMKCFFTLSADWTISLLALPHWDIAIIVSLVLLSNSSVSPNFYGVRPTLTVFMIERLGEVKHTTYCIQHLLSFCFVDCLYKY